MSKAGALLKRLSGSLSGRGIEVLALDDPDVSSIVKHRIPTGIPTFDMITGGGIPCGRMTEIYGLESNGKSSLVAAILAGVQRAGGVGIIIDSEQVFDPARAADIGVDIKEMVITDEQILENVFKIIEVSLEDSEENGNLTVVVWDSVAMGVSKKEYEGEFGDQVMADRARLLNQGLRKINGKIGEKAAVVFVNQVRSKMNAPAWGKKEETVGGHAIRYYASMRVELTRIGNVKDAKDNVIGIKTKAYTTKNKTYPPCKTSEFEIRFDGTFDDTEYFIDLLKEAGVIKQAGPWSTYKEKKFMRKDFKAMFEALSPEERAELIKEVEQKL